MSNTSIPSFERVLRTIGFDKAIRTLRKGLIFTMPKAKSIWIFSGLRLLQHRAQPLPSFARRSKMCSIWSSPI